MSVSIWAKQNPDGAAGDFNTDPRAALISAPRLESLRRSNLLDTPSDPAFDRLTQLARRVLDVPVVLISLVDDHRQFFKSQVGLPEPWASCRETPLSHSFCQYAVARRRLFRVTDARVHPLVKDNGAVSELGVVAYLGAPLIDNRGNVLGSFCAIDTVPREWTGEDAAALLDFAALTMTETELRVSLAETERSAAALAETNRFIERITDTAPSMIYVLDEANRRIVYVSQAVTEILGYAPEQVTSAPSDALALAVHPDDLASLRAHRTHLAALPDGTMEEIEFRMRDVKGKWHWLRSRDTIFTRGAGESDYQMLGILEECTARKLAEDKAHALTHELQRSNVALQEFASVASHDLQEPLRKVLAFGDRLKVRYAEALGDGGRDYLERMMGAANRMQSLINDLLLYSRVTSKGQPFAQVNLNQTLAGVLSDLETRLSRTGGRIEAETLPTLTADTLQMRQLLQNLVGNALKFHKPDTAPVVTITADCRETETGIVHRLCVSDNGIGFDPQYAERVFEVFERLHTRTEYEGTGMGLAICRRIVERHGGSIHAQSVPGEGAAFVVELPQMPPGASEGADI